MARHRFAAESKEHPPVPFLQSCDMGELFPALLPDFFLLRCDGTSRPFLCAGQLCGRFYCRHRADTERSRTVAFRRQDDAHPLWRVGQPGIVFCPDCAYSPDVAGCPSGRICVDCIELYPYARLTGETDRAYPAGRRIKYQNNERKEQINNP